MSDIFCKMNKFSDENKATSEKHVPVIKITGNQTHGSFVDVLVDVGEGKHPRENDHHIQWVELRGNGLFMGRAEFSPVVFESKVHFSIKVPEKGLALTAVARCNLHGLWESREVKLGGH